MGLQNTSDATFTLLLPGLNNVTGRIRYYSFYSWLLDEYSNKNGSTNPEEQRLFIRKAEYIIALTSHFYSSNNDRIPGFSYASDRLHKDGLTTFDLNSGTAGENNSTENTYWKFRWGAFGQYYLGSLKDIGVVVERQDSEKIYARTNTGSLDFVSGEKLAEAFNDNISPERKDLFFNCLKNGSINTDQLKALLPDFNLTMIPEGTTEQKLLIHMLLQKDHPTREQEEPLMFRKKTISHLLDFARTNPVTFGDRAFVYSAYDRKGLVDGALDDSLYGWYFYQFNEFWQFANTSLLNGVLDYLFESSGFDWKPRIHLIEEIARGAIENLHSDGYDIQEETTLENFVSGLEGDEYQFYSQTKDKKGVQKVTAGILLLLALHKQNHSEIPRLNEFSKSSEIARDGEGTDYFLGAFTEKKKLGLREYIQDYLLKRIIHRHQFVAYRKIRGGGLSTQKFILEDNHIRYIENFEAGYTGPRVGNLISFLQDLKVLDEENRLTAFGHQLLSELKDSDD